MSKQVYYVTHITEHESRYEVEETETAVYYHIYLAAPLKFEVTHTWVEANYLYGTGIARVENDNAV